MKIWISIAVIVLLVVAAPASAQVIVATGVADDATEANSQPKIARDHRGTIYLTFVKPVGGIAQIFLASSTDDGKSWRLQSVTTGRAESRYPALTVGPDNTVHVAWTQYEGGVGKVYYARFDGQHWTPASRISPGEVYAGIPALTIDPQGQVHVVWYGIRNQAPTVQTRHGSLYEILYTASTGRPWTAPEVISPGIPDSINPTLGIDRQGRLHSAWYQFDLRSYQVRHTMHDRTWTQPEQVSRGEDASSVAMAIDHNDTVYLVWERHEATGTRIYFAERNQRWSTQEPLSVAGRRAENPSVAVDDRGKVYVAWASEGAIHLTRRTRAWQGADRISAEGHNDHPILASNGEGVDLVWTQLAGTDRRLLYVTLGTRDGTASLRLPPVWGTLILVTLLMFAVWQWRRRVVRR